MPRIKLNEPKERAPLVLACGSPIKILISGKSKKLAIAQTFRFLILREAFLPATQKGGGDYPERLYPYRPYAKPSIAELLGTAWRLFDRSDKFVWNKFGRLRRPKGEWHGCHESVHRYARADREAQGTRRASMGWPFLVRFLATQKMNNGVLVHT